MPVTTTTYDLASERERLDERLDELAERETQISRDHDAVTIHVDGSTSVDGDDPPKELQELRQEASEVANQLAGVAWALDEYGPEAEVTLGDPDTGDMANVTDRSLDAKRSQIGRGDNPSVVGVQQVFYVAAGVIDAPFVDKSAGFEDTVRAVRGLKPQFTGWLESRIDDLSEPEVDLGNDYSERVQAKLATSARKSSSPDSS